LEFRVHVFNHLLVAIVQGFLFVLFDTPGEFFVVLIQGVQRLASVIGALVEVLGGFAIVLERQLGESPLLGGGLILARLDLFCPFLNSLVGIRGCKAVRRGPLRHGLRQVIRLLALRCGKFSFDYAVLLFEVLILKRQAMEHGLDLRGSEQRERPLWEHFDGDGGG
jgi:hypothetical protein